MDIAYINEFYNKEIKDKFDISEEECKLICLAPFKMIRLVMSEGTLKDIRLQYFGLFKVNASRVKYSLKNLEKKFKEGQVSEERYLKRKQVLTSI